MSKGPAEESNRNTTSQNRNSARLVQDTTATTTSAHSKEWSALKVLRKPVNVSYMLPLYLSACGRVGHGGIQAVARWEPTIERIPGEAAKNTSPNTANPLHIP